MPQRQKDTISLLLVLALVAGAIFLVWRTPVRLGLDLQGGMMVVLSAKSADGGKVTENEIEQAKFIIEERVNGLGVTEPQIERQIGTPNIIVQLPGIKDPNQALKLIRSTALLEFKEVLGTGPETGPNAGKEDLGPTLMTGKAVKSARVGTSDLGQALVEFTLTSEGTKEFAKITKRLINKQLAIVLDDKVVSAPTIQSEITGGRGEITGKFTIDEAKDLVLVLNTGALPVKLDVAQQQTVGPTLGQDSLTAALRAGLFGMLMVGIFMLLVYRALGLIAVLSLLVFAVIFGGILTLIGATLTLPGIAGIILTAGLAADSSIVYFERFQEEFRQGREPRVSAKSGFKHAFRAMVDGDMTTLIIAATLVFLSYLYFGSGPIRGFAFTLSIGIFCDLFIIYFFTRPALAKASGLSIFNNPLFIGARRPT